MYFFLLLKIKQKGHFRALVHIASFVLIAFQYDRQVFGKNETFKANDIDMLSEQTEKF